MPGIIKGLVRYSVIGGLCLGGVTLLVGPERVASVFDQFRSRVVEKIDKNIDDPIVLRRQLQSLQEKYPERIEAVRHDLAAVSQDIAELQHDAEVSRRTVALVNQDVTRMEKLIKLAEAKQNTGVQMVAIRFNNSKMRVPEAYAKSAQLQATRDFYTQRIKDDQTHLKYLSEQQSRLQALLVQLETEHAQFQSQLWQLDNQIAAISRNDRLIKTMKEREQRYDFNNDHQVVSLDQLNNRLNQLRNQQEEQLAQLARKQENINYWDKASVQVDAEAVGEEIIEQYKPLDEAVIELNGGETIEVPQDSESPLAMNN